MRIRFLISMIVCTLWLADVAVSETADTRQAQALWLSQTLQRPVVASQILVAPEAALDGCAITRVRTVSQDTSWLSLRCPAQPLPQLVLIKASAEEASLDRRTFVTRSLDHATLDGAVGVTKRSSGNSARRIPPLVRAGATLQADWRTPSLHAEMPVVALDSGASGSLIRVRVGGSNRIMRGRIVTAHTVSIIAAGA